MADLIKDIKQLIIGWASKSISNNSTDSEIATAKAVNTALSIKANSSDVPSASSTTPSADTTNGSVGNGTTWARSNHTHPKSSLYAERSHTHTGSDITGLNITLDDTVTANGNNAVKGSGIKNYVDNAVNEAVTGGSIIIDDTVTQNSTNPVKSSGIFNALSSKADSNSIPTKVSDLTNDSGFLTNQSLNGYLKTTDIGNSSNTSSSKIVACNDSRLSDSRSPTSHTHGNLQNNGQVGSTAQANKNVVTDSNGIITTENKYSHPTGIGTAQTSTVFKKIKYDAQGHITGTADVTASDLPSHTHTDKADRTSVPNLEDITFVSKTNDSTGSIIIGYLS